MKGVKWEKVYGYLGLPDFVLKDGYNQPIKALPEHMHSIEKVLFFYFLYRKPGDVYKTQTGLWMTMYVSEGKIENVTIYDIDG